MLPYRDTELRFLAGHLTPPSPSGREMARAAWPPSALLARGWIITRQASRVVTVTGAGQAGLREWLGVDLAELRATA